MRKHIKKHIKKLPKELRVITPLSITISYILMIGLPILSFWLGMQYQLSSTQAEQIENAMTMSELQMAKDAGVCKMDAKICPDGSSVGRTGLACEFAACPPSVQDAVLMNR